MAPLEEHSPFQLLPVELQAMILIQNADFESLANARLVSKQMNNAVEVACQQILNSLGLQGAEKGNFERVRNLYEVVDKIKNIPLDRKTPRHVRKVAAFFKEHVNGSTLEDIAKAFKDPELKEIIYSKCAIFEKQGGRRVVIGEYNATIFRTFLREHPAADDASAMVYSAIGDLDLSVASLEPKAVKHILASSPDIQSDQLMRYIKLMAKRHIPEADYSKRAEIYEGISKYAKKARLTISDEAWEDIKYTGDINCLLAIDPAIIAPENLTPEKVNRYNSELYGGLIHLAAMANKIDLLEHLISHMPDRINDTFGQRGGFAPLHIAAESGTSKTVQILIDSGADLTAKTKGGWSPLEIAICNSNLEVVRYLLEEKGERIPTKTAEDRKKFDATLKKLHEFHKDAINQREIAAIPLGQEIVMDPTDDHYSEVLKLLSNHVGYRGKAILMKYSIPNAAKSLLTGDK